MPWPDRIGFPTWPRQRQPVFCSAVRRAGSDIRPELRELRPQAGQFVASGLFLIDRGQRTRQAQHRVLRMGTLARTVIGVVERDRRLGILPFAGQSLRQQKPGVIGARRGAIGQHLARGGFRGGIVVTGKGGMALLQAHLRRYVEPEEPPGEAGGGVNIGGSRSLRRITRRRCPELRTLRRPWLRALGIDLERQIVDPLAQILVLLLQLVLRLVDTAAQLANLVFQRIDAGQKLRQQIVGTSTLQLSRRISRRSVARSAAGHLILGRLQFLPQLVDLVLQRDAFAAVHLCMGRGDRRDQKTGRYDEGSNDIPHADFLNCDRMASVYLVTR